MALAADIVGMHYRYPDHYEVEREKIREYAVAVQNDDTSFFEEEAAAELGYKGLLAPLTFICVFGYKAQSAFFKHANVAVKDAQIVQVDQVLKFTSRSWRATSCIATCTWIRCVRRRHPDHRDQEHHHQRRR